MLLKISEQNSPESSNPGTLGAINTIRKVEYGIIRYDLFVLMELHLILMALIRITQSDDATERGLSETTYTGCP
jgi:hypothetical protein